jgi:hypothetical protein
MNRPLIPFALVALSLAFPLSGAQPDVTKEAKQIDAILAKTWEAKKLKGNPAVDDATFVRRIYLDIAGRIPTTRETEAYLENKDANKRAKLIDQLLSGEGYVQHMFNFWADVLRLHTTSGQVGAITGTAYANYVKDALRKNKPYDQFVREMVSAQGQAWENGAIGYYMRDRGMPLDNMAATVRIFLGTRIECAQCHNHPFDKWSQKQFYEMAAFTYDVETNDYYGATQNGVRDIMRQEEQAARDKIVIPKPTREMNNQQREDVKKKAIAAAQQQREATEAVRKKYRYTNEALNDVRNVLRYTTVAIRDRDLRLPHDYQYPDMKPKEVVKAATMMGKSVDCPPDSIGPEVYAKWLTSPENPRFTNVIANRLWKKVFGMGLIEPVDELMDNTVAMNPELMKQLEKLMVSVKYDTKAYLRVLYNTDVYQRAVTREEIPAGVEYHFTGPLLRRMSAEQMWDSFVALINPTPDMPDAVTREQGDRRLTSARKISDALNTLTPEEMLEGAKIAGEKYRESSKKVEELQKQIAEARANDDNDKARKLREDLRVFETAARRSVNDNIYVPAVMKLAAKVNGDAKPAPAKESGKEDPVVAQNDSSMMMNGMMGGGASNYERIKVKGYDLSEKTPEQQAAERAAQEAVYREEAEFYGITDVKQQRDYLNFRRGITRNWLRSAELPSPAPRGHYLREFGQSDRETIENANYDASVPQVLALMNSQLLPQVLERYSQLMLTVNKAPYPDDKVDAIYMTLLSRKPTTAEKEKWIKAQEKGLTDFEDLVYALINTQQFVFIQ